MTPAPAFAVLVAFDLVPGACEAFTALVKENAATSVEREPGCLRFDVLTPGSTDSVLLYEIYTDGAAFEEHLKSPHFLSFDSATQHLVARKTVTICGASVHAKVLA